MAEFLIRAVSKINRESVRLDVKCLKRLDVVVIVENGWAWSSQELTSPQWRIAKVPLVTVAQASGFLAPEVNADPANPSPTLQARVSYLDMDDLGVPVAIRTWFLDSTRAQATMTFNVNLTQLLGFRKLKPPVPDV